MAHSYKCMVHMREASAEGEVEYEFNVRSTYKKYSKSYGRDLASGLLMYSYRITTNILSYILKKYVATNKNVNFYDFRHFPY